MDEVIQGLFIGSIADTELAYRVREFAEKHGIYISDTVRLAIWYYLTMPNQSQC